MPLILILQVIQPMHGLRISTRPCPCLAHPSEENALTDGVDLRPDQGRIGFHTDLLRLFHARIIDPAEIIYLHAYSMTGLNAEWRRRHAWCNDEKRTGCLLSRE